MRRGLVSLVLLGLLAASMGVFGCSDSHRGSSLEGSVAEAWVARSSRGDFAYGQDIAVDASGNVYVTGHASTTAGKDNDYITIKYDSSGREAWSAQYDGPAGNVDIPKAIAVDPSGNVYVTGGSTVEGRSGEGPYDYDYTTIKYSSDGAELWVAAYNGPGNFYDEANAMALDESGNVYVTGTSNVGGYGEEGSGLQEYATVKYDGDGNELWVARYHGPSGGYDCAYAIAVDGSGDVFVTGSSAGGEYESSVALGGEYVYDSDYATVKYDSEGHQLWVARYSGPGSAYSAAVALALDSSGNVYVTGTSQGTNSGEDYVTVKYGEGGKELWVARFDGPASRWDAACDIAVDAEGNAYVTGDASYDDGGDRDYTTVKYDVNGDELWVRGYGSTADGMALDDHVYAIAVDGSGNVYVAGVGMYGEGGHFDRDGVVVKYDTSGAQVWVARYRGGSGDSFAALALDGNGNVYVAGDSWRSDSGCDYLTVKYVPA